MTSSKDQARVNLSPSIQAARTAISIANPSLKAMGSQELLDHVEEIEAAIARLRCNDLSDLERSLMTQIVVLQRQFTHLSQAAAKLTAVDFPASERAFNMAMKAQKALRQTISTLHEFKNPKRTMFINKQQNNLLYQGHPDQIQPDVQRRHVRSQLPQSQQQEAQFNAQMDSRGQSKASRADTTVEAVAAEHRPNPALCAD